MEGKSATRILALLKSHFGYDSFRHLQEEIIASVLAQNDALVLMPTGGGKSLCYQLPSLCFDGLTLVVSPLIALMKDQVDALKANGIPAEFINSTLSPAEISRIQTQAKRNHLKILYLAPERLALNGFRDFLHSLNVSLIAIDEAHCISEWGHDFRQDYRNLKSLRRDFPSVPVIALTATATEKVRKDIVAQLGLTQAQTFLSSFNRANLKYAVEPKGAAFSSLLTLLRRHQNESAIIYCFSRRDSENLAADLGANGLTALPYHAGLDTSVRRETQEKFIRDEVPIIVATIAFGMGIDKPDVRLVVHYDLPKSLEGYYQETGRAGRDDLPSECVLFYSYGDKIKQDYFIDQIGDDVERENSREKLAQMVRFCELHTCRRKYVLEYFGEEWDRERCDGCDVCLTPREEFDATEIVQKILSAVIRTGERFGESLIRGVLRGTNNKRTRELGHDRLTVFGIASDYADGDLKQIIGLLLDKGLLSQNGTQYPTLAVTQTGREFLKRRESLTLLMPKRENLAPAKSKHTSGPASAYNDTAEIEYDKALFARLRVLRKRLADERGVPPYIVFGDAPLQQMAYYFPQSIESFAGINGVGSEKLEQFGEEFLAVIRQHSQENGLKERPIPARRVRRDRVTQRRDSTHEETKRLFLQKLPIREIAQRRGLTEGTIMGHLEHIVEDGDSLDIGYLMPPAKRITKIRAAFQSSASPYLSPVRDLLGEEYSYDELRLVRIFLRQVNAI